MNNNSSLSFDQLPNAVGELLSKVDTMLSRLEDIGGKLTNTPNDDQHIIMNIKEAATFLHKEVSTLYAYTSERRIPFYKRGNTLYFFKDQLVKWVESGGACNKHWEPSKEEQADFEVHLAKLQMKKKHKPAALNNEFNKL